MLLGNCSVYLTMGTSARLVHLKKIFYIFVEQGQHDKPKKLYDVWVNIWVSPQADQIKNLEQVQMCFG